MTCKERRYATVLVKHAIARLEKLQWFLEAGPSREQVVAWQQTVFEPIRYAKDLGYINAAKPNVKQVRKYSRDFSTAWFAVECHPSKENLARLRDVSERLNAELADAYGLPAVPAA